MYSITKQMMAENSPLLDANSQDWLTRGSALVCFPGEVQTCGERWDQFMQSLNFNLPVKLKIKKQIAFSQHIMI